MNLAMDISLIIRKRRMARNLSMRALGKIIGVSGAAVAQWEAGGNITWENRVALSNALDIPITDFLPDEAAEREVSLKDPQEKLLIERYRKVSPKFQRVYLDMLIVQGEQPDEGDPNPPS